MLRAFIATAAESGGALLLSGEPGTGKTALLDAAVTDAETAGVQVLRATGAEFESALAFAGIHQLLHPLLGELGALDAGPRVAVAVALGLLAADVGPRRLADHGTPSQHAHLLVGEHGLDELEVPDRLTALGVRGGVGDRLVECSLRGANGERGDVDATPSERGHRCLVPGGLLSAAERVGRHSDVVEGDVGGTRTLLAHLRVLQPDNDAVSAGGDEEDGDAGTAGDELGGAREAMNRSTIGALVMYCLRPLITQLSPSRRAGPQPGGVRACSGLGQRERGDDLPGRDPLEPRFLLRVGAEPDEHLTGKAGPAL